VSYLSIKEILYLCHSKLFFPCLINSPWFLDKINRHYSHLLSIEYHNTKNLFLIVALHPVIIKNEFYFSIDFNKLPYFKKIFNGEYTNFTLITLTDILKARNILFQPYKKKLNSQNNKIICSFLECDTNLCPCQDYKLRFS